jgi:hypothetical protein
MHTAGGHLPRTVNVSDAGDSPTNQALTGRANFTRRTKTV